MFRRFFIFALVNLAIMVTISLVLNILGVKPYLTASGINYETLLVFCLFWGMGASFISLLLSKKIAKWTMGVQIIDPNTPGELGDLVRTVHRLAKSAGLGKMPEVGYYPAMEVNAFATGPTKNNSLVAVSQGLLRSMNSDEREGVLAHEVAHIANGDMVTMTLIQGVVNAFVMFLARALAYGVQMAMQRDDEEGGFFHAINLLLVIVFEIFFGLLGSIIVAWFSRFREFRADAGGAKLAGRPKMVAALERLRSSVDTVAGDEKALATLKISGRRSGGFAALFMSHPPLEKRIERLRQYAA